MMDFIKIFVVSPFGAGLLLLLASVLVASRRARVSRLLGAASLVILCVASAPYPSNLLRLSLEVERQPLPRDQHVDAILLLGGGLQSTGEGPDGVDLGSAGDRVIAASRLYRAGVSEWVISTGGRQRGERSEAAGMASLLEEWGVPADAILMEEESQSTRENCVFSYELAEPMGIRRIALVTSALHMRRAAAACRKVGFDVTPAPTDWESDTREMLSWDSWIPTPITADRTNRAVHEVIGSLYYALRGWS